MLLQQIKTKKYEEICYPIKLKYSSFLKVVSSGKVFDVLLQIHGQELKHSRYKRVMDVIHRKYLA